ncbi:MAG: CvpA family protein [Alphaproteobacteria bacterium]
MNIIDAIILIVLALSAIIGLIRGLTREGLGLIGWVGATLLAPLSLPAVSPIARGYISNPMIADGITLTASFIILLIAFTIISHILASHVKNSKVGGLDRVLGLGFGIMRGTFMFGTLEIGLSIFVGREQYPNPITESKLMPAVVHLSNGLKELIPQRILDMARSYAPPPPAASAPTVSASTTSAPLPPTPTSTQPPTSTSFNPLQPTTDLQSRQRLALKEITKAAAAAAVDQTVTDLAQLKPQSQKTSTEDQAGYNKAQRSEMDRLVQTTE